MTEKLVYFVILGTFLIAGYLIGCVVALFKRAGRGLTVFIGFAGIITFFLGVIESDTDHRFRILSAGGISLQVASLVSSMKSRRRMKGRSVDLWVSKKPL